MNIAVSSGGIVVQISGELSFTTVSVLCKDNLSLISKNQNIIFDLSQVTSSDNAGVALLVSLTSFAKRVHKEISFINLPERLLDLIVEVGVREILPIG
jgi:anti-anti-sigma factor